MITAQEYLGQISADGEWSTKPGMLQSISWRGLVSELQGKLDEALYYYQKYLLDWKKYSLYYFECSVLTGIGRIKYSQKQYSEMPDLLKRAEILAQQYEYNDHLASLRLTQAHIAWDGNLPEWGSGFEAVLHYYQHALIYALRFNRFLLDEVLWGGGVCTPLRPIIPNCQEHGDEGRRMLTALRDWWQTGVNDIGVARPDTISPIPEGIRLLEAERLARQREPGDGSPQLTVLKRIESALN
ncbi:MAG: hypothetical protein HC945_04335 [Nitrosarchaeum sp.]|nr:hypothetical protein [Nitrosarchaeum sp.]